METLMKKFLLSLGLGCFLAVGLAACGNEPVDNVKKCEEFYTALTCGVVDMSSYKTGCSAYKDLDCNLNDMWDCLTAAFKCVNEQWDLSSLTKIANCQQYAKCK